MRSTSKEKKQKKQAVFLVAPYTALVLSRVQLCRVWRGDSCGWRFTPPLLKAQPRQLSSQPLHRILDPGENECGAEEGTWSAYSLSQGVNYGFPSKYEPRETVWAVIHQPACLHPPEQCMTLGRKEGQKWGDFHLHAHTHTYYKRTHTLTSGSHTPPCPQSIPPLGGGGI